MAHSVSARKRVRQNEKARAKNRWRTRAMKDSLKVLEDKLLHASAADAKKAFQDVCRLVDRTAQKGIIHKNAAARTKSRLSAKVKAKK